MPPTKRQKLLNGSAATTAIDSAQEESAPTESIPKPAADAQSNRSLFVRRLPPSTTSASLTDLFSATYPIKHATAVIDPATKLCKGYGFVTFADAADAEKASLEFDGFVIEGKKLRVEGAGVRSRKDVDGEGEQQKKKAGMKATKPDTKPLPTKLIVRNLPWTIKGGNQLEKLFQSYGKVKQAYVPKAGPGGLMKGFGFVVMRGRANAEKAMAGVNGREVDGRTLAVDWAVEKEVYRKDEGEGEENGAVDEERQAEEEAEEEEREDGMGGVLHDEMDGESLDDEDEEKDLEDDAEDDVDDIEVKIDGEDAADRPEEKATTLFVRNLPFTCTDEDLEDHFTQFGSVRYARIVMDAGSERSKGTGFVCFYSTSDADACLRGAPHHRPTTTSSDEKKKKSAPSLAPNSILQNDTTDPSGQYTLSGRILQVTRAVDKSLADRLTQAGHTHRHARDQDKRRLYLLSEGTISPRSPLWDKLSPSEKTLREASAKQRKRLIESNPSLHLSLTRLSIRNLPRSIGSKELKALAREAVVGFAMDVKAGTREKLSREEVARGGEAMAAAEVLRKKKGKGVVRQAKVVFEGSSGAKVQEESGRSRGYGFVEYYTHRCALMGLRWLNGHAIGLVGGAEAKKVAREDVQDRKKRLVVEFAIENAQVVMRRGEAEGKARERSRVVQDARAKGEVVGIRVNNQNAVGKRKRVSGAFGGGKVRKGKSKRGGKENGMGEEEKAKSAVDEKVAKRNQIIGRKRMARKARKG